MGRILFASIFLAIMGSVAQSAERLALIVANENYREFANARDAFEATELNRTLVDAGFEVRVIRNMSVSAMQQLAPVIRREIQDADRVLVFLAGHVFSSGRESWFMATDAPRQDGLLAGMFGLPIGSLIDLLGEKAGGSVLLVGEPGNAQRVSEGLQYGYVATDVAQGVAVFTGRTGALADLVRDELLVAGNSTMEAAENAPRGVSAYGFLSRSVAFLQVPPAASPGSSEPVDDLELLIWDNAKAVGTVAGISSYLDRYPNGRFVREAQEMLASLQKSPLEAAKEAEQALNLNRAQRRDIQRNLSFLDYDTRGIDGIFGPGTRSAVRGWQAQNGLDDTGYISRDQIAALREQAGRRQLELERADAQFWRQTGRNGDEDGLREYLTKYPDGLYAEIARQDLSVFDEERERIAQASEADAWDQALATDTTDGYTGFLHDFPDGTFAGAAQEKLDDLRAAQNNGAAIADERRVMGSQITRVLVEQKLAALGYKPGRVDGRIDDDTRKAVRKFQKAADLPVSGYVTQATVVRLLAAR